MAAGCPTAHAADPRAGQRASPPAGCPARVAPSYLALLQVEFAAFHSDCRLAPAVGIVTVALVLVSRRTGVTRHPALRSSDFPHALHRGCPRRGAQPSDRLADTSILSPTFSGPGFGAWRHPGSSADADLGWFRSLRMLDHVAIPTRSSVTATESIQFSDRWRSPRISPRRRAAGRARARSRRLARSVPCGPGHRP